jgi:arylformamidase
VNLGQIALSIHSGTHVDAPFHFDDAGARVDGLSLDPFIGPARVVEVHNRPVIRREDLAGVDLDGVGRLLLRTGAWTDRTHFPEAIPVLAEDVPKWLRQRGIVLLGLDVPSVDVLDSKTLPIHHALGGCGIAILESLDLAGVPEGVYELIALPLRLVGADGSPVRAILRSLE